MPIVTRSGIATDGSCSHITIGKLEIPYISFTYGDNVKIEWVYRAGSQVAEASTPGQYETTEGTLKLNADKARAILLPRLPQFGFANLRRTVICSYAHPDIGTDSDALIDFRILGIKTGSEAGSKANEMEFTCAYRMVQWTEQRKCPGNPGGTGARGAARL
jgi:hypothetical protein